ncbi:hypothetical protein AQJ46_42400 [Streptomyces canus]|uniref:Uncharacterized protein n=1 Tax=Streptomyces canus TaxID=58343 RepID=A0A101RNQ3_9ACTN|nr:hypothetical protein AQJ46_42400 [Streptomyces canus]
MRLAVEREVTYRRFADAHRACSRTPGQPSAPGAEPRAAPSPDSRARACGGGMARWEPSYFQAEDIAVRRLT